MAAIRHLGFVEILIRALFHVLTWLGKPHFKLHANPSISSKVMAFPVFAWCTFPCLAWDLKPEVDCRVIRLPLSILTSYLNFSGSYSYLKVSLKILSDDVLRTLPLEPSHVRWKFQSPNLGAILRVFTPKWGVNINSCHSHPQKALPWPERHLLRYSA